MPGNPPVLVYRTGLTACSVCAPVTMSPQEVADAVNVTDPTGISSPWKVSAEPAFQSGEPNPCLCDQHPVTRRHYLMEV